MRGVNERCGSPPNLFELHYWTTWKTLSDRCSGCDTCGSTCSTGVRCGSKPPNLQVFLQSGSIPDRCTFPFQRFPILSFEFFTTLWERSETLNTAVPTISNFFKVVGTVSLLTLISGAQFRCNDFLYKFFERKRNGPVDTHSLVRSTVPTISTILSLVNFFTSFLKSCESGLIL